MSRPSAPTLRIDPPRSLAAIVEERLRDAIVDGEFAFGQALTEDGIGTALGVSRTPLREALTRLEMQGLVVVRPKRGSFVFEPSVTDVEHVATFRLVLETAALSMCLEGARAATLTDLRAAIGDMRRAREAGDPRGYARADTAFHEAFFQNCANPYLQNAFKGISGRIAALRAHLSVPRAHEQATSFREHEAIVSAFETGDPAKTLPSILRAHILRARDVYARAVSVRSA